MANDSSWLNTLRILTENAIRAVPADADLSPEDIARAVQEGAVNTGRVSPADFKSSEGKKNG